MKASARVQDAGATGNDAGQLDRRFVRLGATVTKERGVEVARSDEGQRYCERRRHRSRGRLDEVRDATGERRVHRLEDPRMIVADVQRAESAREIEVAVSVVVPQEDPLRPHVV